MTLHECPRCGYGCSLKADFKKHLNKKKLCKPTIADVSLDDIKEKYNKQKDPTHTCEYCNKGFTSKSGYHYHLISCSQQNSLCVLKAEMETRIQNLEKAINDKITTNKSNTYTNNINIQVNNNIQLREFGKENMSALDVQLIGDLFLNLNIPELLQTLHCNPAYPENHNIRIKSVKRKAIEIFRGNKWDIVSYVNGLNEYILQGQKIFRDYYNKHKDTVKDEMTKEELENIKDTMIRIENLESKVLKTFHNDLALMLESLRTIPKNNPQLGGSSSLSDTDEDEY
jgi:uncharacterized C2H2 Zn-finger protein